MKLTVIRLQQLSAQDRIDLTKIWPQAAGGEAEQPLDEAHRVYAAKFNDRLLAAVRVTLEGENGRLAQLEVREVTRRRGVGLYLLEEVVAQNPAVARWTITQDGSSAPQVIAAFMQAAGFSNGETGWQKQGNNLPRPSRLTAAS